MIRRMLVIAFCVCIFSTVLHAETEMVKDITTVGPNGSSKPREIVQVGNKFFFTADDGINGRELWKTDGTTHGTAMVKDIWSGVGGSNPNHLTAANNLIFFVANEGDGQNGLWRSDGTPGGTFRLKNLKVHATELYDNQGNLLAEGTALFLSLR